MTKALLLAAIFLINPIYAHAGLEGVFSGPGSYKDDRGKTDTCMVFLSIFKQKNQKEENEILLGFDYLCKKVWHADRYVKFVMDSGKLYYFGKKVGDYSDTLIKANPSEGVHYEIHYDGESVSLVDYFIGSKNERTLSGELQAVKHPLFRAWQGLVKKENYGKQSTCRSYLTFIPYEDSLLQKIRYECPSEWTSWRAKFDFNGRDIIQFGKVVGSVDRSQLVLDSPLEKSIELKLTEDKKLQMQHNVISEKYFYSGNLQPAQAD